MLARLRTRLRQDSGVTMIEITVALTVMSVAMTLFTGGIIAMYKVANRSEARSAQQSALNIVFGRLDKEIRYASAISTPARLGSDDYVEYLLSTGGAPQCVQLRLRGATGQLQRRTWQQGATAVDSPGWLTLASNVTSTGAFDLTAASGPTVVQRLRVRIWAGAVTDPTARRNEYTFSALNSTTTTPTTYCTEGRTLP